ncbi:uncharacterized protein H6S33_011116 [Morchella sextelata]|uniref:uncharacterized protein n=1 Tax=Morchella sextelata TaxID=1174677 RepID=UPI001D05541E|nr:uncharacterized protein H6S33_011116 [Morchella sextelata]KAH0611851.1 hypothetical protein H6S33_011116 [Morchella sextelata]
MAFTNHALPAELMLIIGEGATTRELSLLSRTCRTLHTVFARQLNQRFTAGVADIAMWAAAHCRPATLERAIALAIAPVSVIPDGQERLRTHLKHRLSLLLLLNTAGAAAVSTARVLLCHGIGPGRARAYCYDNPSEESCMYRAVRHGDLALARRLLEESDCNAFTAGGNEALLRFARARRFEVPMGANVEEMIQLLVDYDPQPGHPTSYPGTGRAHIMDAWVKQERDYAQYWKRTRGELN